MGLKGERGMKYRAVIFDMDGVLIDSESFYLQRMFQSLVIQYPWIRQEQLYPTVGMSGPEERVFMRRLMSPSLTDGEFEKELEALHQGAEIEDFNAVLYPEVPGVLKKLKERGYQIAVASSSPLRTVQRMVRQCGLERYFDSILTGEQVREYKPDPEIYQVTMTRLGRKPEECLIVEDSTYGVRAGTAAGACVAARLDDRFHFDQEGAAYFIHNLEELWDIL